MEEEEEKVELIFQRHIKHKLYITSFRGAREGVHIFKLRLTEVKIWILIVQSCPVKWKTLQKCF